VVVYVGNTALNYTLGVFVASSGHQSARSALLGILRVPAFYATVVAFLLRGFNIELPLVVFRSVSVLKDAAIPAMLILLGLQLSQTIPVFRWKLVSIGLVLKLLIGPILGIGLAVLFQLQGVAAIAFILQTAMPTAVITLVLAKQYQLDEPLSLNLIMASTLLSPFTLSLTILLLRNLWPL
jgi:predicted permease